MNVIHRVACFSGNVYILYVADLLEESGLSAEGMLAFGGPRAFEWRKNL
jgi:hypothetical protein